MSLKLNKETLRVLSADVDQVHGGDPIPTTLSSVANACDDDMRTFYICNNAIRF